MNHSCRNRLCSTPHEEAELPDIKEMECPISGKIGCLLMMDRNELAAHLSEYHPDYQDDPEPWFDAERVRQFRH